MLILKMRTDKKVDYKKLWFIKLHRKLNIEIHYNIEENGFYYIDNNKTLKLKKDFSRTISMILDIKKRFNSFNTEMDIIDNNINMYLNDVINNFEKEEMLRIILGTSEYNVKNLYNDLTELGINIDPDLLYVNLYKNTKHSEYNDEIKNTFKRI
ncbi:hypothetical protein FPHOBKDP_00133 [Listeria phage LPJP1]|nr:hypothetical protein FPHOBKDP_00133 [Listeria phage LPJP1]